MERKTMQVENKRDGVEMIARALILLPSNDLEEGIYIMMKQSLNKSWQVTLQSKKEG